MPMIRVVLEVKASFREPSHRDAIIETIRQGGQQVLGNILLLTPNGSRIAPSIKMMTQEQGHETLVTDIVAAAHLMATADEEDPFG